MSSIIKHCVYPESGLKGIACGSYSGESQFRKYRSTQRTSTEGTYHSDIEDAMNTKADYVVGEIRDAKVTSV